MKWTFDDVVVATATRSRVDDVSMSLRTTTGILVDITTWTAVNAESVDAVVWLATHNATRAETHRSSR